MIDFLRYRRAGMMFSAFFLIAGFFAYFIKGGFNYHIDFAGGTELRIIFEEPLATTELRASLQERGWNNLVIQSVGGEQKEFLVRTTLVQENIEQAFLKDVKDAFPDNGSRIGHVDWVGAEVGKDIQRDAIKAILLALALIFLYVTIRSRYRYALGALAAISHDMLFVLIALLFLGEQVSLYVLAAILTILGYSLNDTIVIFSKIRENFTKLKGLPEDEIVNRSINQTVRRTLLTSFSTILVVGSIFLLGGPALRGFSLTMLIGIAVGTYSSIYIASPVMLAFGSSDKR